MNYMDMIKEIKNKKKITNDRLAEMTGIPLGTLSKILAGTNESVKLSNMAAICKALGCSLDYVVFGIPENHNNYTLSEGEMQLIATYRKLDSHGRELTTLVLSKEMERVTQAPYTKETRPADENMTMARIKKSLLSHKKTHLSTSAISTRLRREIPLYDMPVSAGSGVYLEENNSVQVSIPNRDKYKEADYAVRVSGNSMEPDYKNGEILLVENTESVEPGELGIFVLDGRGYFKKFGSDRLLSLNPEYGPILLHGFSDVACRGRVVGKLRRDCK